MQGFQPFSLSNVLQKTEQIKTNRHRNNALAEASQPNSRQNQLLDAQLEGAQNTNQAFTSGQEQKGRDITNQALGAIIKNPRSAQAIHQQMIKMRLMDPKAIQGIDYNNLESVQMSANQALQANRPFTTQPTPTNRIGKYNPGDFTPPSWSQFMNAGGGDGVSHLLKRYEAPGSAVVAGVPNVVNRSSDNLGVLTPLSTIGDESASASQISKAKEEGSQKSKLQWAGQVASSIETAKSLAKERGVVFNELSQAKAGMPGLVDTVGELKELAVMATSTLGGRAWDVIVKESGFASTKGATARAKFIAIVNNQVLPLLKQTFGGSFSIQEGQELKASMGDPDASPTEKMAQLQAFIDQKYRTMEAKQNQFDQMNTNLNDLSDEELQGIINGE